MAYDNLVHCNSFNATAALPDTSNFIFVKLDPANAGNVVVCTAGALAAGVIQEGTPSGAGDPVPVCTPGSVTKLLVSQTVTPGQFVSSDANGNGVPATSGASYLGQVIQGATAGFLAVILFQPAGTTP
jgi:hypothetical protein